MHEIGSESNWATPLVFYLWNGMLPDRKDVPRKLKVQASQFGLIKDVLYKRDFSHSYLRCLGPKEAYYVMRKIHQGICRNHSGAQADSSKILLAYYAKGWANLCQGLQQVLEIRQRHQTTIQGTHPYDNPWSFAQWGLDIIGPFPIAVRQLKLLVVGIDYFTKWVEAEALATITEKNIQIFV